MLLDLSIFVQQAVKNGAHGTFALLHLSCRAMDAAVLYTLWLRKHEAEIVNYKVNTLGRTKLLK